MDTATVGAIKEAVTPLVAKLGELGAAGLQLATKQVLIEGYIQLVVGCVLLILFIAMLVVFLKNAKLYRDSEKAHDWDTAGGSMVTSGLVGLLSVIFGSIFVSEAIPMVLNPQWAAISKLAELVR